MRNTSKVLFLKEPTLIFPGVSRPYLRLLRHTSSPYVWRAQQNLKQPRSKPQPNRNNPTKSLDVACDDGKSNSHARHTHYEFSELLKHDSRKSNRMKRLHPRLYIFLLRARLKHIRFKNSVLMHIFRKFHFL